MTLRTKLLAVLTLSLSLMTNVLLAGTQISPIEAIACEGEWCCVFDWGCFFNPFEPNEQRKCCERGPDGNCYACIEVDGEPCCSG